MRIFDFLKDYISFVLFYCFMAIIVSLVVLFDNSMKVSIVNIIYMNIVGASLFLFFLSWEYFKKKKGLDIINSIIDKRQEDFVASLPEATTNEQKRYFELLYRLSQEYRDKMNGFYREKKDFTDFINYWVHEIKTPIAGSKLLLENGIKSNEEILDIIEDKIVVIENYVEQALYFSKTDNFSQDYFIGNIDINELINQIVKKNAKLFIAKRIKIDLANLEFIVLSDRKWISFIIEQVLLNSLKYTDYNGTIKIYGFADKKEKCVVIEDNGIGIKPEDISRVFDKGFTGYNGRENLKATGIGLYLSKKLANKLGHEIMIESIHSEYTKVFIRFPKLMDYFDRK